MRTRLTTHTAMGRGSTSPGTASSRYVPPEEENIAEVIIGKQRNGPTGTIKVVFLPQYARFENAADHHRQPSPF